MRVARIIFIAYSAFFIGGCVDTQIPDESDTDDTLYSLDTGAVADNCNADDGYMFSVVEDFELGAASGTWFANNEVCEDCAGHYIELESAIASGNSADISREELQYAACVDNCDGSMYPNIFDKPLPADKIDIQPRCGVSAYGLHLIAHKLIDWGANVGNPFAVPVDASAYDGVSFWARRGADSRGAVRVELADRNTDVSYDGDDGFCNPDYTNDTLFEGCDAYGAYATVGTKWEFFTLAFRDMRQAGWGKQSDGLHTDGIRSLTFLFPAGQWDIWIDDVAFYKKAVQK